VEKANGFDYSQLDRLWWKWQQRNPMLRLSEYTGKARSDSKDAASLSDVLPMGGLAPDIRASDVMNTESDFLCYRYS
jgi:tyrosinase